MGMAIRLAAARKISYFGRFEIRFVSDVSSIPRGFDWPKKRCYFQGAGREGTFGLDSMHMQ